MIRPRTLFRRLRSDRRGATIIEFAMVAPVMLLMLMGLMELSYRYYVSAMLEGAVQKAARDSTIEGAGTNTAVIDAKVQSMVRSIASHATFQSSRYSFFDFDEVGPPEPYSDANLNGQFDTGECFQDNNGSGVWEGMPGQGGANDVVEYTMTVTYPQILPLSGMLGWSGTNSVSASTTLRNQPYGQQSRPTAVICET